MYIFPVVPATDSEQYLLSGITAFQIAAGLTAGEKLLAVRRKPPHSLSCSLWLMLFVDIVHMEL